MPTLNTGNAILSNAITVDSSYNVGIGGSPSGSYKFEVTGTGNFSNTLRAASSSFPIDIYGTTNNYGLRINSVQAPSVLLYSSYANSGNRNWGLFTNSQAFGDFDIRQSNAKDGDMTAGANSTSRLYIGNNGYIGIGTTTPATSLYIVGGKSQLAIDGGASAGAGMLLNTSLSGSDRRNWFIGTEETVSGDFSIKSSNAAGGNANSGTTRLTILSSGYIGIGTTTGIQTKFTINGFTGANLPYINATSLSYNSEGITVGSSNTGNANVGNGLLLANNVSSTGSYSPVISFSSLTPGGVYNATYAFISGVYQGAGGDTNWSKGDMIFGTGNSYGATLRLKITQDGALLPGADNAYGFGGSGIRWAVIWAANGTIQTSDEREKKDIIDTDLGLDFINKLRPVSFKWKIGQNEVVNELDGTNEDGTPKYKSVIIPREGKRTHYGLIAQEVESLLDGKDFGGFIHDEDTDIKGLRYDQFIAPLIKAIQELNQKLQDQQQTINSLINR